MKLLIIFKPEVFKTPKEKKVVIKDIYDYGVLKDNSDFLFYEKCGSGYQCFIPADSVIFFGYADDAEAFGVKHGADGDD